MHIGGIDLLLLILSSITYLPVTKEMIATSRVGKTIAQVEKKFVDSPNLQVISEKISKLKEEWTSSVKRNKVSKPAVKCVALSASIAHVVGFFSLHFCFRPQIVMIQLWERRQLRNDTERVQPRAQRRPQLQRNQRPMERKQFLHQNYFENPAHVPKSQKEHKKTRKTYRRPRKPEEEQKRDKKRKKRDLPQLTLRNLGLNP